MQTTQGLVALRVGICVSVEGIGLRKVYRQDNIR